MKNVSKPWGSEQWIELNEKYCFKRIHIQEGHRTSLQYHRNKLETNFVVAGMAELELEDHTGTLQKMQLNPGQYATIRPYQKHRITAITNLTLLETSTPEVDDVVRIEDDAERGDGRIDSEHE